MFAAAMTFIAMMVIKIVVKPAYLDNTSVFTHALDAFIIAVTIVVVAVPEGLPLAVTISLAFSTKKMLKDNNLIRHLQACETMGNATNICSDKTGTLTQNRMTVVAGVFCDANSHDGSVPANLSPSALNSIVELVSSCSTAAVHEDGDIIGNKTEGAMLQCIIGAGADYKTVRAGKNFGLEGGGRLFPFSSVKKSMSAIVQVDNNSWSLYHKGAAEVVLSRCTTYVASERSEYCCKKENKNKSSLRSSLVAQRAVIVLTSNSLHQQQQVQEGRRIRRQADCEQNQRLQ